MADGTGTDRLQQWLDQARAAQAEVNRIIDESVPDPDDDSFTCPRCQMTSYHAKDVREGYCGNCHDWTRGKP
jgi:hypothetical protein